MRVLVDENFLNRGRLWRVVGEQGLELAGEMGEAARQGFRDVGLELAVGEVGQAVAIGADQPPAGRAEPRVEAEDLQPSFSSSSSGTS